MLDSRVGALDRTLGFLFGLARGFLLVAIVFILFSALARVQPEWVSSARSYPILQQTQVAIESLLPMNPEQYLPGSLKPGSSLLVRSPRCKARRRLEQPLRLRLPHPPHRLSNPT